MEKSPIKKIGVDIDGVLADFTGEMVRLLRTYFNVDLPVNYSPTNWDWLGANIPEGKMKLAWDRIYDTTNFWESLNPLPEIITMAEVFHEHAGIDWDIFFITARSDTQGRSAKHQSERWLKEYLRSPQQAITVLPVKGGLDKAEMIYTLELTHSIDDHTPTVVNNKSIRGHNAYLLNRSWNQDGKFYGVNIVNSLQEFFDKVEKS